MGNNTHIKTTTTTVEQNSASRYSMFNVTIVGNTLGALLLLGGTAVIIAAAIVPGLGLGTAGLGLLLAVAGIMVNRIAVALDKASAVTVSPNF